MLSIKSFSILLVLFLVFATCGLFVACDDVKTKTVTVYIDGQMVKTIQADKIYVSDIQKLTPDDITQNPQIKKYFCGWFLDPGCNIPLSSTSQMQDGISVYGKLIDVDDQYFEYTVDKAVATITNYVGPEILNTTIAVVPSYINSFPVKTIGYAAFKNQTKLRKIIICDGIEVIGNQAFSGCNSMDSIVLPKSINEIGELAFQNCSLLKQITIPNNVTTISNSMFSGCSALSYVNMGYATNNIKTIGSNAFAGCNSLKTIVIPNSVELIKQSAFEGCENLVTIGLSNSLTEIGPSAFAGCASLVSIIIPQSVVQIGSKAFYGCNSLSSAKFEVPTGWKRSNKNIEPSLLENESKAADVLTRMKISGTSDYDSNYYWFYTLKRAV